jgi:hypothetical protein
MKLITERSLIRTVVIRWEKVYGKHSVHMHSKKFQEIGKKLSTLDLETATVDDVAAIIGNNTWCENTKCNDCGEEVSTAIEVGEEPDYESATAYLCFSCLEKAYNLMKQELHDQNNLI